MNPAAIRQLQLNLKVSPTGVLDAKTIDAMNKAVATAASKNPDVARYAGTNDINSIMSAYQTGNWSGVVDLTGRPFTASQQKAAVSEAEKALAPAYKAQESLDRSIVTDELDAERSAFDQFRKDEALDFRDNKNALDNNAASEGILFSGARAQRLNDLRNTYEDREALRRSQGADSIRSTARSYQYEYGDEAANRLSSLYQMPGTSTYNPNVAGGKVTTSKTLTSAYNPEQFKFQGVKPVAQKAAVQTRAASLLGNRANKLSAQGYKTRF